MGRGGGGRGGGGGGGGGADSNLTRDLLHFLQQRVGGGGGRYGGGVGGDGGRLDGGGRGGRAGGRAARGVPDHRRPAAGARQVRDGDWECPTCAFFPNFRDRQHCFDCGRPRPRRERSRGAAGGGNAAGPVGADGARPVLAWGARAGTAVAGDQAPTRRVPGASVAARAEAATRAATQTVDDDGYTRVQRRGKGAAAAADAAATKLAQTVAGNGGTTAAAAAARRADGSGSGLSAHADAAAAAATNELSDDDADQDANDVPAGPAELRRRWNKEVSMVRGLKQRGTAADHPAMQAAVRARDEAEGRWRAAKSPVPLATRLARAQGKLDRAFDLQQRTRDKLAELEQEYKARRDELGAQLDKDRERVDKRREAVEELQVEAGATARGGNRKAAGTTAAAAAKSAIGTIRDRIAPAMQLLAEQLGVGTPAWATVNGLMGELSNSQLLFEDAVGGEEDTTERYDIGGDGGDDLRDDDHDDDSDGDGTDWSESLDVMEDTPAGQQQQQEQRQQQQLEHHWQEPHAQTMQSHGYTSHEHAAIGEWPSQHWGHAASAWASGMRWAEYGHGKWTRTSWADAWEEQQASSEQPEGPQQKFRRMGAAEVGVEAQAAAAAATDAAAATGAAERPSADEAAAAAEQQHRQQVARVVEAAIEQGVQPLTPYGQELLVLDPAGLARWVDEHLQGGH